MTSRAPSVVRVWDLPTRIFHWTLLALVVAAFVTINAGGDWVAWHFRCGYAILTLILFRLVWGIVGGRHSRFASFVHGPRRILAYLRGAPDAPRTPGHNPLGALSVLAMLAVLATQASLGLFANDDIVSEGPLAMLISKDLSDTLTGLHHRNAVVIIALVVLHIGAIVYYRVARRENLVAPMLTGDKRGGEHFESSRDDASSRIAALFVFAVCALLVWGIVTRFSFA